MDKKYELTSETVNVNGHILHRIKALRDFSNVKVGDLGGFIEAERNLSYLGDCWIYDDAQVFGKAYVYENVRVYGDAQVFGSANISGKVQISGNARVFGNAWIGGNIQVRGNAWVGGSRDIYIGVVDLEIDHGIWTQFIKIDDNMYLISSTLEKLLVGVTWYEQEI